MQAHDSFGGCHSAATAVTAASVATSSEPSLPPLTGPLSTFCPIAQKRAAAQIFLFLMNFFKRGNKPIEIIIKITI